MGSQAATAACLDIIHLLKISREKERLCKQEDQEKPRWLHSPFKWETRQKNAKRLKIGIKFLGNCRTPKIILASA